MNQRAPPNLGLVHLLEVPEKEVDHSLLKHVLQTCQQGDLEGKMGATVLLDLRIGLL